MSAVCASILTVVLVFSAASGARAQADDEVVSDSKTPPAQMAGTWTGSIEDVKNGEGTLTLNLTQVKSTVGELSTPIGQIRITRRAQ